MELTDLQLEIMKLGADKTLSFGCLIADKNHRSNSDEWVIMQVVGYNEKVAKGYSPMLYWQLPYAHYTQERNGINHIFNERMNYRYKNENTGELRYEILGHPITRGRLCYLFRKIEDKSNLPQGLYRMQSDLAYHFNTNPELYNQNILERPEETQLLVRDFLLSIQ